jgi:hypothetical protein
MKTPRHTAAAASSPVSPPSRSREPASPGRFNATRTITPTTTATTTSLAVAPPFSLLTSPGPKHHGAEVLLSLPWSNVLPSDPPLGTSESLPNLSRKWCRRLSREVHAPTALLDRFPVSPVLRPHSVRRLSGLATGGAGRSPRTTSSLGYPRPRPSGISLGRGDTMQVFASVLVLG